MDLSSLFIGLLLGLFAGALGFAWWIRGRDQGTVALLREQHAQERADLERRLAEQGAEINDRNQETKELSGLLAAEVERKRGLQEKLDNQRSELEESQKRMTTEFEVIANRLLKERGKELNEQQQEKLGTIIRPLHDKIKDFEEQVRKAYENEGKERHLLKSEVAKLVEQNQRLSKDADNLTKALKGDSQAQGAWGEMLLEKLTILKEGAVIIQHR